jgi:hypothetical protein
MTDLKGPARIDFIKTTLHYKRRLVSHFYMHLVHLAENKIIPEKVLYAGWKRDDLKIIPTILAPVEQKLASVLGVGDSAAKLQRLYDGAIEGRGDEADGVDVLDAAAIPCWADQPGW